MANKPIEIGIGFAGLGPPALPGDRNPVDPPELVAVEQPADVDVGEVGVRPTAQG